MKKEPYGSGNSKWFVHDRFGLFIHWGLYAAAARHEWVKSREQLSTEEYQKYFDHFDPDLYDPTAWALAARAHDVGVSVVVTSALESGVGLAGAVHLAAALPYAMHATAAKPLAAGLATGERLATDTVRRPIVPRDGDVFVPSGAGLGIEVRRRYR